jgi:hypothetical protein
MTYIEKINCFADAEARYNNTKPVVSKRHTLEQDVRPIGARTRKWERIIKVSDTCYALSCGGRVDPVFTWGAADLQIRAQYPITPDEIALMSPIVWRKHPDGTETVSVRNGAGNWNHNNIYSFLARALPRDIWFQKDSKGKQFLYNRARGQTLFLPKNTSAPAYLLAFHKQNANKYKNTHWFDNQRRAATPGYDGLSVVFERGQDGIFTLVGKPQNIVVERIRVNKSEKGEYKDAINQLFDDAMALYPLMKDNMDWQLRSDTVKQATSIAKDHKIKFTDDRGYSSCSILGRTEPTIVRAILSDPDHPLRHTLNIAAISTIDGSYLNFWPKAYPDLDEDALDKKRRALIRSAFVRWINTVCGFTVTIMEEKKA